MPAARGKSRQRGAGLTCCVTRWTVTVIDQSDVLVIRVWVEDGMDSFRSRLTAVRPAGADDGTNERTYAVASAPSDVLDAVREWLGSFEQRVSDGIDS